MVPTAAAGLSAISGGKAEVFAGSATMAAAMSRVSVRTSGNGLRGLSVGRGLV